MRKVVLYKRDQSPICNSRRTNNGTLIDRFGYFSRFLIFNESLPDALRSNGSGGGSVNGQLATSNLGRDREESSGGERGQGTSQASDGF